MMNIVVKIMMMRCIKIQSIQGEKRRFYHLKMHLVRMESGQSKINGRIIFWEEKIMEIMVK